MTEPLPRFVAPAREYSGYVFDCDGTLVDTMPLHHQAWIHALGQAGAPFEFPWELFVSRAGMSLEQTARELGEQFGFTLDAVAVAATQRQVYDELALGVQPVREVVEFARALFLAGKPLAVASGSERASVENALRRVGILEWFRAILTPADVRQGKPAPDMFLLAAELLGQKPSDCLVVEDGEMGFEAARRASMDFVVVRPLLSA